MTPGPFFLLDRHQPLYVLPSERYLMLPAKRVNSATRARFGIVSSRQQYTLALFYVLMELPCVDRPRISAFIFSEQQMQKEGQSTSQQQAQFNP
jgi:hypothetical protein